MSNLFKKEIVDLVVEKLTSDPESFSEKTIKSIAELIGLYCYSCENRGYIEVTREDLCEYIEACDACDHFGVFDDKDIQARIIAEGDGYKLDEQGKIKE